MIKPFLIICFGLLMACTITDTEQVQVIEIDQCLREELFKGCLSIVPKGPEKTKYNDWDEVIAECRTSAYYNSLRKKGFIKPECALSNN